MLWKAYIDFEINEQEFERARQLYERLLDKTSHVKVCLSVHLSVHFSTNSLPLCLSSGVDFIRTV